MTRLSWIAGPAAMRGSIFVSATRFTYRRSWHMPFVLWHGLALRRRWGRVEGAVGLFSAASLLGRTTYTVTAWRSEQELRGWMRSPYHLRLMQDYRGCLESAAAVSWRTERFEPEEAWREAMSRLGAGAARQPASGHSAACRRVSRGPRSTRGS
ncbi:MAG TPA: hypothetical protein VE987_08450 [Polyangiaceae bacterium]|nr:hypothetical protein [Polyangiaceae bacterium]